MDNQKLQPILMKESILKTANAGELKQSPQDVLQRYQTYALTHIPLGETSKQLANLRRVITTNKKCAIGTIVGPYGYGKTSTAVHLWHELRAKKILAIPPFQWINLQQVVNAVYYWIVFEFSQGPKNFIPLLDELYERYKNQGFERLGNQLEEDTKQDWFERGLLNLELRPEEVVRFFSETCDLCQQAGYDGLAIFTDELQVTLAEYKPSRDQFFNDLFQIVKDTLDKPGNWALLLSMDDSTEGTISRLRADLTQRMQSSALYFRVRDVYNRREYPKELWSAFEKQFGFDGSAVILPETLESIGQIAAREDLGSGPRMVTKALTLAIKHYETKHKPYTPLNLVDDFLAGQLLFDQRGKFGTAVKKALDTKDVQASEMNQQVIKLLAAFPYGCSEGTLAHFKLLDDFKKFPPLSRKELIYGLAEGQTLRALLEDERPPEQIEQRLIREFVARFSPSKKYAEMAADGFLWQLLLSDTFKGNGWKQGKKSGHQTIPHVELLVGSFFDKTYPQREVALAVSAIPQSQTPSWKKLINESEIEFHFELNYELPATEPSQLFVAPNRPEIAVFQFNLQATMPEMAHQILPDLLFEYYQTNQLTPLLCLALLRYIFKNSGDVPADKSRLENIARPLRQYVLTVLLGERLIIQQTEFISSMVGHERIKELFKAQCQALFPNYKTLITSSSWQENLQQYNYVIERVIKEEGVSVVRGLRSWETTKSKAADAFRIPRLSLTRLDTLLNELKDFIIKEDYSGQPDSPIRLKFQVHPLETQWLDKLDDSSQRDSLNGMNMPALDGTELLRQTRYQGYKNEEMGQVLKLMQSRQFITYNYNTRLLLRAVDAIDDLKVIVQKEFEGFRAFVIQLEKNVPEFDSSRFSLSNLESRLGEAKTREELEERQKEIRRYTFNIQKFARERNENHQKNCNEEIDKLDGYIQQGIPEWLKKQYIPSPLQAILEQQRLQYIGVYEKTLQEVRQLVRDSRVMLQELPNSPIEKLIALQKKFPELRKNSTRLQTRLTTYNDSNEDFNAWHRVIQRAQGFESDAKKISEKYSTSDWDNRVEAFWQNQQTQMKNANPLTIIGLHNEFQRQLTAVDKELASWLENQRENFERQCSNYAKSFSQFESSIRLQIRFNQQEPEESYNALWETVFQELKGYLAKLENGLNQILQKVRYIIQVQKTNLVNAEEETQNALKGIKQLQQRLTDDLLRDLHRIEQEILQPMKIYREQLGNLDGVVQQTLQKQPPSTQEKQLLEFLQSKFGKGEADLYSLIMSLLDHEEQSVELSELMDNLRGLFQKNQIGLRIRVL